MKRPGIALFKKILGILGCMLFTCSIILPFFNIAYIGLIRIPEALGHDVIYYWSFKASYGTTSLPFEPFTPSVEYWFYENGFYQYVPGPSISYLLLLMLITQILTLSTGIASLFFNRRVLTLAPLALCSLATVMMTYTIIALPKTNSTLYPFRSRDSFAIIGSEILTGYWLTYTAIILFLFYFILSIIDKKKDSTYTPTPTQTQ